MAEAPREVLLLGYYGFGNVGDDALFEVLAERLQAAGVARLWVPAGDAARVARPGVVALGRNDLGGMARALRDGAAVVCGGGGLFQDTTSLRSLLYYAGILRLARALGRPYALVGHSVGPLHRGLSRRLVAAAARRAVHVSVRDGASAELLESLGVAARRVPDLAFALAPPSAEELARAAALLPGQPPRLALCLRPTAHTERVLDAVAEWWPQRPAEVVAVACQAPDAALHRALAERVDPPPLLLGPLDPRAMLALLASCDGVLSERLHPLIFALASGVPAAGIVYDPKVAGLAADHDLPLAGSDADVTAAGIARALAAARAGDAAADPRAAVEQDIDAALTALARR